MTQDKPAKKRWPWWAKLLVAMSPLFVLLVVVMVFEASGQRAFKRAMQEAHAIGGPVTFEEIEAARKTWPNDQNGALIMSSVLGQLTLPSDSPTYEVLPLLGGADLPPLGEKWSDQTDEAVRSHLAQLTAELSEINKLAGCPGGRFPIVVSPNPFNTILPNLSQVRGSCKLKSLEVIRKAMHGDTDSLVTDMDVLLAHGRSLAEEPHLISSLVCVATDSLSIDTLEHVLALAPVKPDQLERLETLIGALDTNGRLCWGLRGERALIIGGVQWMTSKGSKGMPGMLSLPLPASTPGLRGWMLNDLALTVTLENKLVQAKTGRERIQAAAQMDAAVQAAPKYRVLLKQLVPSLRRACEIDLRLTATARAARVALAAERYRIDKGQFPADLAELVPGYLDAMPTDPFDDKPMRYRREADAVVIYSVGEDKTDNGGKVQGRVPPKTRAPDAGFVLLKPDFRGRPASTTAPATQEADTPPAFMIPAR